MGDGEPAGLTQVGAEHFKIEHVVTAPIALLDFAHFASPWFTNDQFIQRGIHFRVGMSDWDEHGLRLAYVQCATSEEVEAFNPYRNVNSSSDKGTKTDLLLSSIRLHLSFSGSNNIIQLRHPEEKSREAYLTTMKCVYLSHIEDEYGFLQRSDFASWTEGEIKFDLKLEALRAVVLHSSCAAEDKKRVVGVSLLSGDGRSNASSTLTQMLTRALLPDVKLRVEGVALPAHRAVLAASSKVFEAMFAHDMKESKGGEVDIEGVRADVMSAALKFMYGGEDVVTSLMTDESLTVELLAVAERYELLPLKDACVAALVGAPSSDPLLVLLAADKHNAPGLRRAALRRIVDDPQRRQIITGAVLKDLQAKHPLLFAELCEALL